MSRVSAAWATLRQAYADFQQDRASTFGAALAYYTMFSLAPILVVAIGVAGVVFGSDAARAQATGQIAMLVGADGARAVDLLLANASRPGHGVVAIVTGSVALLLGASGVVLQLEAALNRIWEVRRRPAGWKGTVLQRLSSFGLVLGVGFLLLVSLLVSAALSGLEAFLGNVLPGAAWLWQALNAVVSLGVVTLLFAMIFRFVPAVRIGWRDVWIGAGLTAALFTVGKFLIGIYLGRSGVTSAYGAAGSIVLLMVWVYYSAQILLFGAEVTQVIARRAGRRIEPDAHAIRVPEARTAG